MCHKEGINVMLFTDYENKEIKKYQYQKYIFLFH